MQLLTIWPANQPAFSLERFNKENPACFSLKSGQFSEARPAEQEEVVWFYHTAGGPVIFNTCRESICRVDETTVEAGQHYALRFNSIVQVGHYAFELHAGDREEAHQDIIHDLFDTRSEQQQANLIVPEVEDILPNGGHFTGDYRYLSDADVAGTERDVLKNLEIEYKKFLIWGEQSRTSSADNAILNSRLPGSDDYFEAVREEMKAKTLTECIIQTPSLIDKVWDELNVDGASDELLFAEEKTDILKLLAPENISSREKKPVPELVFHDLYKPGLDSPY